MKTINVLFEFSKTYVTYLSVCLLGALATMRKATISFVMYVRLSVGMKQLGSNWKNFREILYLSILLTSVEKNSCFIKIWEEMKIYVHVG